MVHIYDHYTPAHYWMLDSGQLRDKRSLRSDMKRAGFPTNKHTSTARMRELFIRCQRGLLSYERLPSRDLKLFAAQRGLPVIPGPKTSVAVLRAQLEQADDDATFDRFSDLPPELRQLIYTHYFKSLNQPVSSGRFTDLKCQPPMTLSSRDTRRESLTLFYESCVFLAETWSAPRHLSLDFTAVLSSLSSAFLKATAPQNFARIKSIDLCLHDVGMRIVLDLNSTNDPLHVKFKSGYHNHADEFESYMESRERLLVELRTIATEMATRTGPLKLRQSDIQEVYATVRSYLYDYIPGY